MKIAKEWLDFLREQYPAGSRIQLTEMGSDPAPIPPGTTGVLEFVDDLGTFHVKWNNGRELGVVIGEDRFKVLPPEPTLLRLYMPLTADFYPRDEWGDVDETGEVWDGRTLMDYEDQILGAMVKNRIPEEKERGLMHWYQMVTIDAKREQFCFYSMADLYKNLKTAFRKVCDLGGMDVIAPKNMDDTSLQLQMMYVNCYKMFQNDLMCVMEPTPQVLALLEQRMLNTLQTSALTVRGLKRFVKEHKEYLNTGLGLNPNGSNKKSIFMFYILFLVGKSEGTWQGLENVNDFIKETFGTDTINVSDELSKQLLLEMLETEGYFETIKAGAVAIENWKYE